MGAKGYFIQYKFILPESTQHSSYSYQKLFRALYGYTQAVFKSNGKNYRYHRKGVLSDVPYLRPGKNCVIAPPEAFSKLIDFFKTGKNPTHAWRLKGDWKAVYYMNEKTVDEKDALKALEEMIDRQYIITSAREHSGLLSEMTMALKREPSAIDKGYIAMLSKEAEKITGFEWFKQLHPKSEKLSNFYSVYKKLKSAV